MLSEEDYIDLPEDSELAFLKLEREAKKALEERLEKANDESPFMQYYQDYVNSTLAAALALDIEGFLNWKVPQDRNAIYEDYRRFCLVVEQRKTAIRVHHSRRAKQYSVAMESSVKEKISLHLSQLKNLLDELDLTPQKRDAVFQKIIALEEELHRDRTRFEVVADFVLGCATVAGQTGEKFESWRRIVDSVANLISVAKGKERNPPSLPPPSSPKKLEPPKRQLPPPNGDDNPF